jgi:hypothetical protein
VNEEEADVGEVSVGNGKLKKLSPLKMESIHEHVLTNYVVTKAPYM